MALRRPPGKSRRLQRLSLAALAVILIAAGLACGSSGSNSGRRRPNVVILLADDLGYGDTGLYGARGIPTPNIDSLATHGVLFTSGYVTASLCSPSRAALLTGRYQQRFGYELNAGSIVRAVALDIGLPTTELTIADILHRGGYRTGVFGKWHLGINDEYHPNARGFEEFYGYLHGPRIPLASMVDTRANTDQRARRQPELQEAQQVEEAEGEAAPGGETVARRLARLLRNSTVVEEPDYLTDVWTREAVDFVERHKSEPFLLYVPFNSPHRPIWAPQRYLARFPQIADPRRRAFVAMVSALDDGVGAILAKLRQTGLERDTLLVFLSDNGCSAQSSPCSNAPLAGGKFTMGEGGIRVPFVMQWPAILKPGQTYDAPVSAVDLVPTAAAAAGVDLPKDRRYDGVDLIPFLTGQRTGDPHEFLYWRKDSLSGVRRGQWKLTVEEGTVRLFDLYSDPGEQHDLADEQRDLVETMRRALTAWEAELPPPLHLRPGAAR